ncbi:unnamed protein product [Caretta caretta]
MSSRRPQFYQQVSDFLGTLDSHECLVLGGDFNTTLEERDRSGAEPSPAAANILQGIVDHHSLVDVWRDHHPDDTSTFTFVRVEAHRSHHSRLDRIYLSRFHLSQAHSSAFRPAPFSDHHLVTVTVSLRAERPGPAYWHFNNSLLEDESFVMSFREFWLAWREQWRAFPSVRRWWDLGKVRAKLFCRDYTRGTSRRRNAAIEQLEREVLEMERRLAADPEDPSLCGPCREKREELQALEDHRARGAFVRSRIRLLREMDRGSRFFYALEKTRGAKKHVTCLLAEDGTPLTDPEEMCGRARDFYTSLFSPDPTDPDACEVLWEELPTVSVGDRDRLERPLTLAEFSEALRRMPTNKSPGMDGLTVEFYRAFWDILGPDLVIVWAESLQSGVLPLSCRRAVLALLPKKGDLRDLRNWRPVSLLSTDYKIVAKAISLRLGSVMADVVHPDQTYTVPGRSIFDNLFLVRDLLELGRRDGLSFALLSLDQEKAFDRVDHGYLLSTLQAFGFGPQFGLVLREPELRLVLSAYADDVLLVVQDPGDLARVEACQAIYSAASSARVNWVKSSGLAVGDWRQDLAVKYKKKKGELPTLIMHGKGGGMENIKHHTFALSRYTYTVLSTLKYANGAPIVRIYSDSDFSSPDVQGPIINFNVLDENGDVIGYSQVDKIASLYNIHIRTGCFCNTGACQQHLRLSNEDVKRNLQAGHVCGDDIDIIDGRPTGSMRISFGYMSTFEDAQTFLKFIIATRLSESEFKFPSQTTTRETITQSVKSPIQNDHSANSNAKKFSLKTIVSDMGHWNNSSAALKTPETSRAVVSESAIPVYRSGSKPITVTNVYLYPIKSCSAFEVSEWPVGNQGLLYDRSWMVVNQNGVCISQKQEPRLCLVHPLIDLEQRIMVIKAEGMDPISVPLEENTGREIQIGQSKVCAHRVQTYDCGERIAEWFSELLGRQCHLIRQSSDFKRNANQKHEKGQATTVSLSLVNEAQYLLINTASILQLKEQITERLEEPLQTEELIQRFRANIVISATVSFEEEEWVEISIGALRFQVVGPCNRCQIICIDPQTGQRNKEFLQTLSSTRGRKTNFGIYLMNQSLCSSLPNILSVGSQVFPVLKEDREIRSPLSNEEKTSG